MKKKILNENNIKNNLEFYKQRNDIDSQSEKDIEDATKSIREELIGIVMEKFRKKISPGLPTEIFVFQEENENDPKRWKNCMQTDGELCPGEYANKKFKLVKACQIIGEGTDK